MSAHLVNIRSNCILAVRQSDKQATFIPAGWKSDLGVRAWGCSDHQIWVTQHLGASAFLIAQYRYDLSPRSGVM